jgi:hypothetical protein
MPEDTHLNLMNLKTARFIRNELHNAVEFLSRFQYLLLDLRPRVPCSQSNKA